MGITAETGPSVTFGQAPNFDSNPDAGPNAWYQGDMLLDPRIPFTYQPGENSTPGSVAGWLSTTVLPLIGQIPTTLSTTNIVNQSSGVASGTPLVLASSSVAGITVGCSIINALTGVLVTGLIGIDVNTTRTSTLTFTANSPNILFNGTIGAAWGVQVGDPVTLTTSGTIATPFAVLTTYYVVAIDWQSGNFMLAATPGGAPIVCTNTQSNATSISITATSTVVPPFPLSPQPANYFGQGGTGTGGAMRAWNAAWSISRCLILTNNGNDTSGTYVFKGFDVYGFPMTATVTGPSTSTVNTLKAFKYIQSITPQGTIASTTVQVGTTDAIGLPLRTDIFPQLVVWWGATNAAQAIVANVSTAFVSADPQTATATSGDVRGTILLSAFAGSPASNSTRQLFVYWSPLPSNMGSTVGILGQPQF
jgi:hypothetical protein